MKKIERRDMKNENKIQRLQISNYADLIFI